MDLIDLDYLNTWFLCYLNCGEKQLSLTGYQTLQICQQSVNLIMYQGSNVDSTGSAHLQGIPSESHSDNRFKFDVILFSEPCWGRIVCTGPAEEIKFQKVCRMM